jgi:hypothetical protein
MRLHRAAHVVGARRARLTGGLARSGPNCAVPLQYRLFGKSQQGVARVSTIALPRPNTNGGLRVALVALLVAFMYGLLLLLPQVAVREMRIECREQPIYLTDEKTGERLIGNGRYLVADDAVTCR